MPRIANSNKDFKTWLTGEIAEHADTVFKRNKPVIEQNVKNLLKQKLVNNEAIQSLLDYDIAKNSLKKQFGLTDQEALISVDLIIESVVNSVEVVLVKSRRLDLITSFTIRILPKNLMETLANAISYVSQPSGSEIKWLEWLLLKGLEITVEGWSEKLSNNPKSRAGGIMKEDGGYYRVDSRFAGTIEDNFLTRVILESNDEILSIIRNNLK